MKRVYLDHAAATPCDPRVAGAMEPFFFGTYGNPSAIHAEGVAARSAIEDARSRIARLCAVHADEIVFTGSATESANLAIIGAVRAWRRDHPERTPHIIVSAIEHDAVRAPAETLLREGVRVTRLSVNADGVVDCTLLKTALTVDTVLVAVMYANNEIGTIQPIKEIAKLIRKWKKEVRDVTRDGKPEGDERYPLLQTDATQAVNYCDMSIPALGVDMLTMNAAKIYGPKGVGLLYVARGTPLLPIVEGGGQERGRRAGTEHGAAIVGFAEAFTIARAMTEGESARLVGVRDRLITQLGTIPDLVINGSLSVRLPNNVHFSLPDVDHEFLALALDARGFAVATKSACNETDAETSHVLTALREAQGGALSQSGLRLSLGRATTTEDVDAFVAALRVILSTMIVLP